MSNSNNNTKKNVSPEESNRFSKAIDEILKSTPDNDDDFDYDELEYEPYQAYTNKKNESDFEI